MKILNDLKIKIFADGADLESIKKLSKIDYIKGYTTNPSLMKKAGITDYKEFALKLLSEIKNKPISFIPVVSRHGNLHTRIFPHDGIRLGKNKLLSF